MGLPAIPLACGLFVVVFLLTAVAYRIYKDPAYLAAEAQYEQQVHRNLESAAEAAKASNETDAKLNFLIDVILTERRRAVQETFSPA
jgi:hypothetical protein